MSFTRKQFARKNTIHIWNMDEKKNMFKEFKKMQREQKELIQCNEMNQDCIENENLDYSLNLPFFTI
jgi:hypothetical protein